MLDISVIIACFNGAETLGETLESLTVQECDRPWEILLADNGSTDASAAIFEGHARAHPEVRMRVVDAGQAKGKSHALNVGIRAAAGRALLFCDADDTVAPGWLAAMGAALDRHPFVAARIDLDKLNAEWLRASRGIAQVDHLNRLPHPPYALIAAGGTLGFRREVFAAVGEFDPAFVVMEDIDFCSRAHLKGFTLVFVPEALCHYRFRSDLEGTRRQAYSYAYLLGAAAPARRQRALADLRFGAWAALCARAGRLVRRRLALALRPGRMDLRTRAKLARISGHLWGQFRVALAFRVAPSRSQPRHPRPQAQMARAAQPHG